MVIGFDGQYVILSDDFKILIYKFIWVVGVVGNKMLGLLDEVLVKGCRFVVDCFNWVQGMQDIFVIGDIVYMEEFDYFKGYLQVVQVVMQYVK